MTIQLRKERLAVDFYPNLISESDAARLFDMLIKNVKWKISLDIQKRTSQSYGDIGISYQFTLGGYQTKRKDGSFGAIRPLEIVKREVLPWSELPILKKTRDAITSVTGDRYNYCVVQYYANGKIEIKRHRDKEMLHGTTIAGLSLGATRRLKLCPPTYNKIDKEQIVLELNSGSLYTLLSPTNDHWMHSIEKDITITEPRISITFRYMENA